MHPGVLDRISDLCYIRVNLDAWLEVTHYYEINSIDICKLSRPIPNLLLEVIIFQDLFFFLDTFVIF